MNSFRNVKLLGWLNFCNDFRIYSAIAVIYFAQITGSYALALGIFSIARVSSSLFEIPTGIFSDLIGRKKTVMISQFFSIFTVVFYAFGGTFVILVVGAIFEGLSRSFASGNNSALLYYTLKEKGLEKDYSEYDGKIRAMFQFALGVSALLGSFVLGFWSFQYLFWLSVIPQVIGFGITLFLVEPKKHFEKIDTNIFSHLSASIKNYTKNKKLQIISFIDMFEDGLGEAKHQFTPAFYALLWPTWLLPLASALSNLFAWLGYTFSGRVVKKFGELRVLIFLNTVTSFIGIGTAAYPTILTPIINTVTSFGFGLGSVAKSSLLQKEFSDEQRSTMGSINSFFGSLFFGIISVLLGLWADNVGIVYAVLTAQCLTLTTLYFYWKLKKYL